MESRPFLLIAKFSHRVILLGTMLSKHDWSHAGYDAEELYFEKLNRELINRLKAERDTLETQGENERPLAQVIPFPSRKNSSSGNEKKAA